MKRLGLLVSLLFAWFITGAQDLKTENVILVTFDGLRWQEVFSGADKKMLRSEKYTHQPDAFKAQYWHKNPDERRKLLMPFFWSTLAAEGQLIGNRRRGSKMNLTTSTWISYPGYNEILSGRPDHKLKHNWKINNPNVTVLEWIQQQPGFYGKVAMVGSWDTFPYILNTERSGIPVNAGNMPATGDNLTQEEQRLNKLLADSEPRWEGIRRDTLTFLYAMEYLKKEQPRVFHLGFGETDEFGHEGNYGEYLHAIHRSDAMIQQLWEWLQSQEQYRDKTTLVIVTDHGRGHLNKMSWKKHGRPWYPGSNHVWMAVIGPDTPPAGEQNERAKFYQHQIAGLIAQYLGLTFRPHKATDSNPAKSTTH